MQDIQSVYEALSHLVLKRARLVEGDQSDLLREEAIKRLEKK